MKVHFTIQTGQPYCLDCGQVTADCECRPLPEVWASRLRHPSGRKA